MKNKLHWFCCMVVSTTFHVQTWEDDPQWLLVVKFADRKCSFVDDNMLCICNIIFPLPGLVAGGYSLLLICMVATTSKYAWTWAEQLRTKRIESRMCWASIVCQRLTQPFTVNQTLGPCPVAFAGHLENPFLLILNTTTKNLDPLWIYTFWGPLSEVLHFSRWD